MKKMIYSFMFIVVAPIMAMHTPLDWRLFAERRLDVNVQDFYAKLHAVQEAIKTNRISTDVRTCLYKTYDLYQYLVYAADAISTMPDACYSFAQFIGLEDLPKREALVGRVALVPLQWGISLRLGMLKSELERCRLVLAGAGSK